MTLQSKYRLTFELWYDLRQRLPFAEKYEDFYVECLEEIEKARVREVVGAA
jgi:hypothetical protein